MRYDTAFCEREYNNRAMIPDHAAIFARWAGQGAAARRDTVCRLDIAYGEDPSERLDYFPTVQAGAPLFVFIHGGYWRSLDKSDFSWIAPPLALDGANVALLNYALCPAVTMEAIVRQVLSAFAWLHRHAGPLDFDRDRIVAAGHSAGGHLAAMMLAARWRELDARLPSDMVKGALAVSGLYDLEPLMYAPFVNADLRLDQSAADRLSPALFASATDAPLVTAVGGDESGEFKRQNRLIAEAWPRNFRRDVPMPGFNHLTVCDQFAEPASPLFVAALELLGL